MSDGSEVTWTSAVTGSGPVSRLEVELSGVQEGAAPRHKHCLTSCSREIGQGAPLAASLALEVTVSGLRVIRAGNFGVARFPYHHEQSRSAELQMIRHGTFVSTRWAHPKLYRPILAIEHTATMSCSELSAPGLCTLKVGLVLTGELPALLLHLRPKGITSRGPQKIGGLRDSNIRSKHVEPMPQNRHLLESQHA